MGATGEPQSTAVDVQQLLDECGMSRFNVWLVAFTFFLVLFDGYDVTAMGFAAPAIIKAWHITDTAAMGRVLAASMFGMLFGGPLFGYIGDRYGRKVAIVSATLSFGVLSWATTFATSMGQLAGLRFLAGLGIAGVMPNVVGTGAEVRLAGAVYYRRRDSGAGRTDRPGMAAGVHQVPGTTAGAQTRGAEVARTVAAGQDVCSSE